MTKYIPKNGWVEGKNLPRFCNRYIYEGNTSVYIMAGDRPVIRLGERRNLLGTLRLFYGDKPLEDCADITMRYRPGVVEWKICDPDIPGEVALTVTSPGEGLGIVVKVDSPVELRFLYGGLRHMDEPEMWTVEEWSLDVQFSDTVLSKTAFKDAWLKDNCAVWTEDGKEIELSGPTAVPRSIYVKSDRTYKIDGCQVSGTIGTYFTACFEADVDAGSAFAAGYARSERFAEQIRVNTPDEYINAACAVAAGEMDGAWHPPKTMHGTMRWVMPFVGWLSHCGHTMLGLHDRTKELLKAYAAAQVKTEKNIGYAMEKTGTRPAGNSRFYGKGHIGEDQNFYNMQTQFFHQMILAWRFSGDSEFGELLRDALRLHLEWQADCFDPDDTGLYASVINTWPTDSVFYSDAGAVEETAYAYFAHRAMAELTVGKESEKYARKAEKIKEAFFKELWIPEKGYPGIYRDRGGRLHEDSWIYASFLPVECGLLDMFEATQALYYPVWALEKGNDGGFWSSNWLPGIWSVRTNADGENMQQAGALLKGGKEKEGLDILTRSARQYMDSDIPGKMMWPTIECSSLFLKVVVEELFGYQPDYPHGRVTVAPVLPFAWGKASMQTGDVSIEWERRKLRVKLVRPAAMTIRMRLFADELYAVNGAEEWSLEPGIGGMTVVIKLDACDTAEIELHTSEERDFIPYEDTCTVPMGEDIYNPQGIGADSWGEHMVFRKMPGGYYQEVRVHLGKDPVKELRKQKQRMELPEHAKFEKVDITRSFNEDVTRIFKNQYLSPRPAKGCYAQISYDGFSPWTFPCWGVEVPEMTLEKHGEVKSQAGIPFDISGGEKNIAFASLWDNYPDSVEAVVGRAAKMAAVLVCGSTNPMQCGIENARLTFTYEDGFEEELPLTNPDNYISLCAYPEGACSYPLEINGHRRDVFHNPTDGSLMKDFTPEVIQLGENVRALSVRWPLAEGRVLKNIRLTACSRDIVVGLMGITLMI